MDRGRTAVRPDRESGDTVVGAGPSVRAELDGDPRCVRVARRLVTEALADWDLDHLQPTAVLLVSELSTNAVLHARSSFLVEVRRRDDVVRVAVTDAGLQAPLRRQHSPAAGTGRGLGLVATLSTAWGTDAAPLPWHKTVWFELPVDPAVLPEFGDASISAGA